ncbi:MAG: hypothetical protein OXB86_04510 [Bdellovibrionales bacterium]|nr:hypothetical protein [Bdellovibrionales bacterium]
MTTEGQKTVSKRYASQHRVWRNNRSLKESLKHSVKGLDEPVDLCTGLQDELKIKVLSPYLYNNPTSS